MSDTAKIVVEGTAVSEVGTQGTGLYVLLKSGTVTYRVLSDERLEGFTPGDRLHVEGGIARVSINCQVVVKATVARTP